MHHTDTSAAPPRRLSARALRDDELDLLLRKVRGERTAFGVVADGSIVWRLGGPERALAYQLVAETGLAANELASLVPGSFDLDIDLATVTVEPSSSRHRRRECRPLRQSTAAVLREYLRDRNGDEPAFSVPRGRELIRMFRVDLDAAGISCGEGRDWSFQVLRRGYVHTLRQRKSEDEL